MERNNTGSPIVETKQTEKKRKTGKTSMKYSQKNKRPWERFYLEGRAQNMLYVGYFYIVFSLVRRLIKFSCQAGINSGEAKKEGQDIV